MVNSKKTLSLSKLLEVSRGNLFALYFSHLIYSRFKNNTFVGNDEEFYKKLSLETKKMLNKK